MSDHTPTLKHVLTWDEARHCWSYIKAEKAAEKYRRGVSADERLFVCELCGQSVALTQEGYHIAHFRHARAEDIKNCPERANASSTVDHRPQDFSLPLKLVYDNQTCSIRLYLGILFPAGFSANAEEFTLQCLDENGGCSYPSATYSFTRFKGKTIAYLSVSPAAAYRLRTTSPQLAAQLRWPEQVSGIRRKTGAVFDGVSCKHIPFDGDVEVGRDYYVLADKQSDKIRRPFLSSNDSLQLKELPFNPPTYLRNFSLYQARALQNDFVAASFFMGFGLRLTDEPVKLYPLWPITVKNPYRILSDAEHVFFYVQGKNARNHLFPRDDLLVSAQYDKPHLIGIRLHNDRQLLSAGRRTVLKYAFLEQQALPTAKQEAEASLVQLTNVNDDIIDIERLNKPILEDRLRISVYYKGHLDEFFKTNFVRRVDLTDAKTATLELARGHEYRLYVGQDLQGTFVYAPKAQSAALSRRALRQMTAASSATQSPAYPRLVPWLGRSRLAQQIVVDRKVSPSLIKKLNHHDY